MRFHKGALNGNSVGETLLQIAEGTRKEIEVGAVMELINIQMTADGHIPSARTEEIAIEGSAKTIGANLLCRAAKMEDRI